MRFARVDVRDRIVSLKNHHGPCRTCISVPENTSDSGEPFPGPELKPRRRKSQTLYGVG